MITPDPSPARPHASPEVSALFTGAECWELWGPGDPAALHPHELTLVEGAVGGRVAQFAAGRQCAHQALDRLGAAPGPILRASQRAPRWPPGFDGSIAHTEGYAVAVVNRHRRLGSARRPVGVDVEQVGRVSPELYGRLFTPDERARLAAMGPDRADLVATTWFGLKEAFYKAQFALTGAWVGFGDVTISPSPGEVVEGAPERWVLAPATDLEALAAVGWPIVGGGVLRSPGLVVTGVEITPARS